MKTQLNKTNSTSTSSVLQKVALLLKQPSSTSSSSSSSLFTQSKLEKNTHDSDTDSISSIISLTSSECPTSRDEDKNFTNIPQPVTTSSTLPSSHTTQTKAASSTHSSIPFVLTNKKDSSLLIITSTNTTTTSATTPSSSSSSLSSSALSLSSPLETLETPTNQKKESLECIHQEERLSPLSLSQEAEQISVCILEKEEEQILDEQLEDNAYSISEYLQESFDFESDMEEYFPDEMQEQEKKEMEERNQSLKESKLDKNKRNDIQPLYSNSSLPLFNPLNSNLHIKEPKKQHYGVDTDIKPTTFHDPSWVLAHSEPMLHLTESTKSCIPLHTQPSSSSSSSSNDIPWNSPSPRSMTSTSSSISSSSSLSTSPSFSSSTDPSSSLHDPVMTVSLLQSQLQTLQSHLSSCSSFTSTSSVQKQGVEEVMHQLLLAQTKILNYLLKFTTTPPIVPNYRYTTTPSYTSDMSNSNHSSPGATGFPS